MLSPLMSSVGTNKTSRGMLYIYRDTHIYICIYIYIYIVREISESQLSNLTQRTKRTCVHIAFHICHRFIVAVLAGRVVLEPLDRGGSLPA